MTDATSPAELTRQKPGASVWIGRILSTLLVLFMASGVVMFAIKPDVVKQSITDFGWPERFAVYVVVIELACVLLYAIPQTAVLGAILLSGYLGGAVATHFRVGDWSALMPLAFGVIAWLALFLREPRLRRLIPLRF
ncbi:MAG: DoxX family protein [Tepidisphaeraceae bacterium]